MANTNFGRAGIGDSGRTYIAEIAIKAEIHLSPRFRETLPSREYFGVNRGYWGVLLEHDHLGTQRCNGLLAVVGFTAADRETAEDWSIKIGEKLGHLAQFYGGSPGHSPMLKRLAEVGLHDGVIEQNVYSYLDERDRLRQVAIKPYEFQKLLTRIGELEDNIRQVLELAIRWHINSLSSESSLDGYLAAWIGLEAIGPKLDDIYHHDGPRSACILCGNPVGTRRDRKLAGIEHIIRTVAEELLDGRTVQNLAQIRNEIAHCRVSPDESEVATSLLLKDMQLCLAIGILNTAGRGSDYHTSFSSFLPRDYEIRPDARASIKFEREEVAYKPFFGQWVEFNLEYFNEQSRLEANGSYVWGPTLALLGRWQSQLRKIVSPNT